MAEQLPPDSRGQNFSSADVARAGITAEEAGRILLQYIQAGQTADPTALLAALVRQQTTRNCRFLIRSIDLPAATGVQQIAEENPLRAALIINFARPQGAASLNADTLGILFETTSYTFRALTAFEAIAMFRRSLQPLIVDGGVNDTQGGNRTLIFTPPPINAISIINNGVDVVQGVVLEGV
jgi:hypothetical protein